MEGTKMIPEKLLWIAILLRLAICFLMITSYHPDEYYQSREPAWEKAWQAANLTDVSSL